MHVGKSYSVIETILWTRRRGYALVILSLLPVAAYQLLGLHWIAMPWQVAALLGTATAFIVGFKNAQIYNRTEEAQRVWSSIGSLSRHWAISSRDLPRERQDFERLVRRHLAWLTVLRYQARNARPWETTDLAPNEEFRRRHHLVVAEHEVPLAAELGRLLTVEELAILGSTRAKTTWLLGEQSRTLRSLYESQGLAVLHHTEMQRTLAALLDHQARVERLKNFPYPRQYAVINKIFVWTFAVVLPFCLVAEFDRLNAIATGMLAGQMAWMTLPFGVMLAWLYLALDQVGESSENPFEGGANDVPISHVSLIIEADLRMLLGERDHVLPKTDGAIVL